jgi:hypothetical protein
MKPPKIRGTLPILSEKIPMGIATIKEANEDTAAIIPMNAIVAPTLNAKRVLVGDMMPPIRSARKPIKLIIKTFLENHDSVIGFREWSLGLIEWFIFHWEAFN